MVSNGSNLKFDPCISSCFLLQFIASMYRRLLFYYKMYYISSNLHHFRLERGIDPSLLSKKYKYEKSIIYGISDCQLFIIGGSKCSNLSNYQRCWCNVEPSF